MPSKAWVLDVTYIQSKEEFVYLTTIMNLYDRRVIGWSLSDGTVHMKLCLVLEK
ncbi:hypothetical protein [Flavobacterium sp. LB2R40]|uniref:hypothetical protein n=1 Tax=unclassified Flavobacterium TaxID=196869 RepID=UPI003AB003B8